MVGCCQLLGVGMVFSYSWPRKSDHHVPVNLQQDKCYSLFCKLLSPYEGKSVIYTLKGKSLEIGLFRRFQAVDNILCFF